MNRFLSNMKWVPLLFLCLGWHAAQSSASNTYQIEEDTHGTYIQTESDGGWKLNPDEVDFPVKAGDSGTYRFKTTREGTYLVTSHHGTFLVDAAAVARLEAEQKEYEKEMREAYQKELELMKEQEKAASMDQKQPQVQINVEYVDQGKNVKVAGNRFDYGFGRYGTYPIWDPLLDPQIPCGKGCKKDRKHKLGGKNRGKGSKRQGAPNYNYHPPPLNSNAFNKRSFITNPPYLSSGSWTR